MDSTGLKAQSVAVLQTGGWASGEQRLLEESLAMRFILMLGIPGYYSKAFKDSAKSKGIVKEGEMIDPF